MSPDRSAPDSKSARFPFAPISDVLWADTTGGQPRSQRGNVAAPRDIFKPMEQPVSLLRVDMAPPGRKVADIARSTGRPAFFSVLE